MSKRDPSLHKNHRERTFAAYLDSGANIPDHVLLEMLLFYSIPRKDTNETAHRLINTFGSLSAVFEAGQEELTAVEGIGRYSADLIRLISTVKSRALEPRRVGKVTLSGSADYCAYIRARFSELDSEAICVLIMDASHRLINAPVVRRGGIENAELCIKDILRHTLCASGDLLVVGHSHPSRNTEPSDEDVTFTLQLRRACDSIGIRLEDHVILSGGACTSVFEYLSNHRPQRIETVVINRIEE